MQAACGRTKSCCRSTGRAGSASGGGLRQEPRAPQAPRRTNWAESLMPGIEIAALTKVFPNGVTALDGLDLSINDGEFFALLGPSGCGKTTLLRTIAGLEAATSGTIHIGARDVTGLQPGDRNLAMVFQDYALYPHMTVRDNIAYPLKIKHVGRAERNAEAESRRHQPVARPPDGSSPRPALRWPATARRSRQGDRHATRRVPVRRAALQSRRPVAPGGAHVPQAAAARAGDDGDLRHPRPERGAGPRRSHGRDGIGRDPPGRHADRTVPPSGQRVRRRVHRLDTDEPAARRRDGWRCRRRWNHPAARRHDRRRRPSR